MAYNTPIPANVGALKFNITKTLRVGPAPVGHPKEGQFAVIEASKTTTPSGKQVRLVNTTLGWYPTKAAAEANASALECGAITK